MKEAKKKLKSAIPEELLAPLGKVVANFAVLENVLSFSIGILLEGNSVAEQRTGQIVTAELNFKNKISLFSSLYQHKFPERKPFDELTEIRKKLTEANRKRNRLLHSTWLAGGVRLAVTAKEKRGIRFEFQNIDSKKIEEISELIAKVSYELQEFSLKF